MTAAAQLDCIESKLLATGEALDLFAQGREAAVLMPFRETAEGALELIFTKRRDDLPSHAGQISFPGGSSDPGDADHVATALRESEEELGIPESAVRVIGALEPMSTFVSDFAVYPIAGVVDPAIVLMPNPGEVDQVFSVAVAELIAVREHREMQRGAMTFKTEAYETDGGLIWGVTGYILGRLLDRIGACFPEPTPRESA
ncbi:MAG: NUDIX hydrolase [Solirubrobacterales bacterium]